MLATATAIFDHLFIKSNISKHLNNGQVTCREISQKHCKEMAFHDTKKNNGYHSLFTKLF